jgi:hypothetical protein
MNRPGPDFPAYETIASHVRATKAMYEAMYNIAYSWQHRTARVDVFNRKVELFASYEVIRLPLFLATLACSLTMPTWFRPANHEEKVSN